MGMPNFSLKSGPPTPCPPDVPPCPQLGTLNCCTAPNPDGSCCPDNVSVVAPIWIQLYDPCTPCWVEVCPPGSSATASGGCCGTGGGVGGPGGPRPGSPCGPDRLLCVTNESS
jgi:hypothetical protein